ncbi:MAG: hypothetical protein WCK53_13600, partial [Methanomicrobiales archaeon]
TNQHGIPLFMEPLSGNESDKKTLLRTIEEVRKNLITDENIYHMAECDKKLHYGLQHAIPFVRDISTISCISRNGIV